MELSKEIEKSLPLIEKLFSEEELTEFKNTLPSELNLYHFGLGTWIRNNLLIDQESPLCNLFSEHGLTHRDDMSSFIIKTFHAYVTR